MSLDFDEKVAALHRATRFVDWRALEPNTMNSQFAVDGGLVVSSTLCRLEPSQYLHLVAIRHAPQGVDGAELVRQLWTEEISKAPPLPPLTDEPGLLVELLSRLGVTTTTVQKLPADPTFGFTVRFSFSRDEEEAFQSRESAQSTGSAPPAPTSPRKWWQFW